MSSDGLVPCACHQHLNALGVPVVPENNAAMTGSYVMLDPLGRPFQNFEGRYAYGPSITDKGLRTALRLVGFDHAAFIRRGGSYEWGG